MSKTNKITNWNEFVVNNPDMYAVITDVKEKDGEIQSCTLLDVVTFEDRASAIRRYKEQGYALECIRTTYAGPNAGVMC